MTPAQRRADYIETFAGEVGQRVLFDLLHRVLMHGASPFPPGPDPSALLLAKTAGKQEAAAEILEIMTIPLVQVTEGNLRSYTHED